MIDRTNLPDFLQEMPVERLRELMNVDDNSGNFDKTMDKMLHTDKKKKAKARQELNPAFPTISNQ